MVIAGCLPDVCRMFAGIGGELGVGAQKPARKRVYWLYRDSLARHKFGFAVRQSFDHKFEP
ncbi:hypothetical protein LLE49_17450 [Alicyclobacillus tolerans]|uniref:hypothetical protein n=1 Tax=Alicyclobacillus tolerans TaxID=90970 RepID=UPI001F306DDB|nr:hypothetical protein [Alicyclobacillus tolerans]MCF8566512.1 hypothetical protein [Alicyclobacillus tolerans]